MTITVFAGGTGELKMRWTPARARAYRHALAWDIHRDRREWAPEAELDRRWPLVLHATLLVAPAAPRPSGAGRGVVSPDDIILPDFVTAGLRLEAGWDNWSGYYVLSEDEVGDTFLMRLARAYPALSNWQQ